MVHNKYIKVKKAEVEAEDTIKTYKDTRIPALSYSPEAKNPMIFCHGKEVLPQDTTHLVQRPCYQRGSPCQDPAGNRTIRRSGHRKETRTEVVGSCLPFIRSGQNQLVRHSERGQKTRQTEEEL